MSGSSVVNVVCVKESFSLRKLLIIITLAILVGIFSVDRVSALSQVGSQPNFVLGQPNLNGCATGPNSMEYDKSFYLNGTQVSVFDGKLLIPSGSDYRVMVYNSIPTQNQATVDVVVGGPTVCNRYPSWEESEKIVLPIAVAYDGSNFLVSEYGSHRINIYTGGIPTTSGQKPDYVIGQTARSDSLVQANQGVTVAANTLANPFAIQIVNGKLIVADRGNNRVLIYNTVPTSNNAAADVVIGQPNMTSNTANNGGISASTLNAARGVYSDGTKLYISDSGNSRVLIFNTIPTTNFAAADVVIGQPNMTSNTANNGGISANSLHTPYGVHAGQDGKLYVADYNNNRVLIYNTVPTVNFSPADVVVGQPNMTSNTANNGGIGANTLSAPAGVTTNNGKLITAEVSNNRVLVFNTIPTTNNAAADVVVGQPNMTSANVLGIAGGVTSSTLGMPYKLMFDGTKTFVTDYMNHRVLIYNGLPTTSGASADIVVGQADMVSQVIAVAANRLAWVSGGAFSDGTRLFIADSSNNRMLIYNSIPTTNNASADVVLGQPNMTSSTANNGGISAKSLSGGGKPYSDGTRLFVADPGNHRVLIYNTIPTTNFAPADVVIGQPDMTSNTANNGGISAHSLNAPYSVFVRDGRLYITDSSNNRVLIFNTIPTSNNASADIVIGQPDMVSNTLNNGGISNKSLWIPFDVFVDEQNTMVVADYRNSRALLFHGIPTTNFKEADVVVGQADFSSQKVGLFNNASAVSIANKTLYVSDFWGDRILGFTLGTKNESASAVSTTNTRNISINLSATDAKDVMLSENPSFAGASWASFSTSKPFTISSGDGVKTIYVKYRDYARYEGNVVSLSVRLDTRILGEQAAQPTPSVTPTPTITVQATAEPSQTPQSFEITIVDQNGNPIPSVPVFINGQKYTANSNGRLYIDNQLLTDAKIYVEIKGVKQEGSINGSRVIVEIHEEKATVMWIWWLVVILAVLVLGLWASRRHRNRG